MTAARRAMTRLSWPPERPTTDAVARAPPGRIQRSLALQAIEDLLFLLGRHRRDHRLGHQPVDQTATLRRCRYLRPLSRRGLPLWWGVHRLRARARAELGGGR